MNCECLPFTAIPHTSPLFRDYLYNFDRVHRFFAVNPRDRGLFGVAGQDQHSELRHFRQELPAGCYAGDIGQFHIE